MDTSNTKTLRYSPDNGATWMGPFSQQEIDQLKAAGIIDETYLIKDTSHPAAAGEQTVSSPSVEEVGASAQGAAPPPIPPAPPEQENDPNAAYYINLAGSQKGPYTISELRQLIANHTVHPATMCWTQGMENWKMAKDVLPEHFAEGGGEKLEKLEGFFITRFFADVFKRHQPNETEDLFCSGSHNTTPPLESVQTHWPSPWIFARLLVICILLYFGFNWAANTYENLKLIPGLLFVGNFGIPFCVAILFFELNVRRDVPFIKVTYAMIAGGLISLVIALFLFDNVKPSEMYWAGPIEEPAKLLATLIIAAKMRNGKILTGLLLGCSVGAGFAAFESAGYTFEHLVPIIQKSAVIGFLQAVNEPGMARRVAELAPDADPDYVMQLRALLTPFGHVVWTAITAGAYWFVQNLKTESMQRTAEDTRIDFSILTDIRFLRIALIPVVLHMIWNSTLFENMWVWRDLALGVVGWIIALRLVQAGLNQIKAEKIKIKH